jgi:hypothetical protein
MSTLNTVLHKGIPSILFSALLILAKGELVYPGNLQSPVESDMHNDMDYANIRTPNGKLYAYTVLLFNENPHFVNVIQEHTIPLSFMQKEGFHVLAYKNYLNYLQDTDIYSIADLMLNVYLYPAKYEEKVLYALQELLEKRNIILRFSRDRSSGPERIILDYCIYGSRKPLSITHPMFHTDDVIYNIVPFIYYDEFSTSNSTFYFDMIYINPEEVQNDFIIAKRVLSNENVDSMFFVGSRVTEDIKYCLLRSFTNASSIKGEIWKLFEIHELTHKILNNHYNYFDQIMGEELALSSTIFSNVFLGLSVLYSYLDYNTTNPHRIAAMNYLRFFAAEVGKKNIVESPSIIKYYDPMEIQKISRQHFDSVVKSIKEK